MAKKLVVFDVDETLIDTKIGSFKDIGILLGKETEVKAHDAEYQKRKHLGPWGLDELAAIFAGIPESKIKAAAEQILEKQLMPGAEETIAELRKRGYMIVSYSSSPMWIMSLIRAKFKLDDVCGNVVESVNGTVTGKLLEKVDRFAKAKRLSEFMQKNGIKKEDTYIVGDSVTDLPMAELGHFIAFNAEKDEVRKKAEFLVDKKDLREVLRCIE